MFFELILNTFRISKNFPENFREISIERLSHGLASHLKQLDDQRRTRRPEYGN